MILKNVMAPTSATCAGVFYPVFVFLLLVLLPSQTSSIMAFPDDGVYSIFPHEDLTTGKRIKFDEFSQDPASLSVGASSASLLAPPGGNPDRGRDGLGDMIVPILRPTSASGENRLRKLSIFSASEPEPEHKVPFHPHDPPNIFKDDDVEITRTLENDDTAPIRYYEHRRPRIFFEDEERRLWGYGGKYYHNEYPPKPDDPSSENNVIKPSPIDYSRDYNLHRFYLRNPPASYLPEPKLPPYAISAKSRRPPAEEEETRPPRIHLFTSQNIDKYGVSHRMHHMHPDGPVHVDAPGPDAFINHDQYLDYHTKVALATLDQERRKLEDARRQYIPPKPLNNVKGLQPPMSDKGHMSNEQLNDHRGSMPLGPMGGAGIAIMVGGGMHPAMPSDHRQNGDGSEDCVRLLKNCREKDEEASKKQSTVANITPAVSTNVNESERPAASPFFTPSLLVPSGGSRNKHSQTTLPVSQPMTQATTKFPSSETGFRPSRPFPAQGSRRPTGTMFPMTGLPPGRGETTGYDFGTTRVSGINRPTTHSSSGQTMIITGSMEYGNTDDPSSSSTQPGNTDSTRPPGDEIEYGTVANFNFVSNGNTDGETETTPKIRKIATMKPLLIEYGHDASAALTTNPGKATTQVTQLPRQTLAPSFAASGPGSTMTITATNNSNVVTEKAGASPVIFIDSAELDGFYVNSSAGSPHQMMIHVQRVKNNGSRRKVQVHSHRESTTNTTTIHHQFVSRNVTTSIPHHHNIKSKLKVESTMKFHKNPKNVTSLLQSEIDEMKEQPVAAAQSQTKAGGITGINSGVVSKVHAHISDCPKLYGSVEIICDITIKPRHGHPNPRITVGWIRKFYTESEPDKVVAVNKKLAYEEDFHDKFNVTLAPGIAPMLRSVLTVREVTPQDCGSSCLLEVSLIVDKELQHSFDRKDFYSQTLGEPL